MTKAELKALIDEFFLWAQGATTNNLLLSILLKVAQPLADGPLLDLLCQWLNIKGITAANFKTAKK
jgi:hypothetical protein